MLIERIGSSRHGLHFEHFTVPGRITSAGTTFTYLKIHLIDHEQAFQPDYAPVHHMEHLSSAGCSAAPWLPTGTRGNQEL